VLSESPTRNLLSRRFWRHKFFRPLSNGVATFAIDWNFSPGTQASQGILSTLFLFLFFAGSCVPASQPVSSVPEKGADVPQRVYALEFDAAWKLVLEALEKNRIPMQIIQKRKGILKTGYQNGEDVILLREVFATRYKFNISVLREDQQRTIVSIRCVYEIRKKKGGSFAEATTLAPREVRVLEKKMYRLLESHLRPYEKPFPSGRKGERKDPSGGLTARIASISAA
jgi:hypothetical protein